MVVPASKNTGFSFAGVFMLGVLFLVAAGFRTPEGDPADAAAGIVSRLNDLYSRGPENGSVRKFEFTISSEGFFRYRKIYTNGKNEYFSFGIGRLDDVRYLGSTTSGRIIFKTRSDDIIVQTFSDPRGNVDSMATELSIPLRGAEAEDLQLISSNLEMIRRKLQAPR